MFIIENASERLGKAIYQACEMAVDRRNKFVTPEHVLWAFANQYEFFSAFGNNDVAEEMEKYIDENVEVAPGEGEYECAPSSELDILMMDVNKQAESFGEPGQKVEVDVPHMLLAMCDMPDHHIADVLARQADGNLQIAIDRIFVSYILKDKRYDTDMMAGGDLRAPEQYDNVASDMNKDERELLMKYTYCISDNLDRHTPLIGRKEELDRTIQVLCRKDKNNPLHIGDPGVGKTTLVYGLAKRIQDGDVPGRLKGSRIYAIDFGVLLAGTQMRGELEVRFKSLMDILIRMRGSIAYIDEIHNVVGEGKNADNSLSLSDLLKPYLEDGQIRFIGATTYDEYKRTIARNKGIDRRFQKIDIKEPDIDTCKEILHSIKGLYEEFHKVTYTDEAIDFAVTGSDKYINDRRLPDKAIDLIDECGALKEMHRDTAGPDVIGKADIKRQLSKICNAEILAEDEAESARLETLETRIKRGIYGQDEAVSQVTEAVLMSSAGLNDDNKPMASLLFVGPTGVGKTELARVLAKELSLPLLRFDMSEYSEKHTVSKLIGSPAGYVGYDDGGMLTDAVIKSPHSVLLFDEIEKAHPDIYNTLLQVMDYGSLTDNKGKKADFRHAIIIMTTNAGAQFASKASLGFNRSTSTGLAMMKSVKGTFKPEFLNRLTAISIFNDMDRTMAGMILDKKLSALTDKLSARNVTMTLTPEAREHLLEKGFSPEYGGREIDRVLSSMLRPMLTHAILYGELKNGGTARVGLCDGQLRLMS